MAIAYKSQGTGVGTETTSAALQPACPATVDANDILVAHVVYLNNTTTPSTPSNWTLLFGPSGLGTGTPTGRAWAFGKIAVGDEGGDAISFGTAGGTSGRLARIYSFSGYVSGSITDVIPAASFAENSSESDPVIQAVTTTVAGAKAVALVSQDDNNSHAGLGAVTGGTWVEAVADYVNTSVGAQGAKLQIQVGTPTSDPGTINGGTVAGSNDECNTLNFEIRPNAPVVADELLADDLTAGTPVLGTPAPGQVHAVTATALSTGAPTLGSPALGQVHAVVATGVDTGVPTLDTPSLAVAHPLTATALSTGAPTLGPPALGQVHAVTATGVDTGAPVLGEPATTSFGGDALTANNLAAGAPTLGEPGLSQTHTITASALSAGAVTLGAPALGQVHSLTGLSLNAGSPTLTTPAVGQEHGLVALGIDAGAPTLGEPGQASIALTADGLDSGAPTLGSPEASVVYHLVAWPLYTVLPRKLKPGLHIDIIVGGSGVESHTG